MNSMQANLVTTSPTLWTFMMRCNHCHRDRHCHHGHHHCQVATIARPPVDPAHKRPTTEFTGYIICIYQVILMVVMVLSHQVILMVVITDQWSTYIWILPAALLLLSGVQRGWWREVWEKLALLDRWCYLIFLLDRCFLYFYWTGVFFIFFNGQVFFFSYLLLHRCFFIFDKSKIQDSY